MSRIRHYALCIAATATFLCPPYGSILAEEIAPNEEDMQCSNYVETGNAAGSLILVAGTQSKKNGDKVCDADKAKKGDTDAKGRECSSGIVCKKPGSECSEGGKCETLELPEGSGKCACVCN